MSKPKKFWLSRDKCSVLDYESYELWLSKPTKNKAGQYDCAGDETFIAAMCPDKFESMMGLELNPGQCKGVTIEIKLV